MPNLLIGLCKGARYLKGYSQIFHNQLGYDLFRLELAFQLANGRNIIPDAIVTSKKLGTTLLFEWTEAIDPSNKQEQLNRYAMIQPSDITNIAAVPPAAVKKFDLALTLRPQAAENFSTIIPKNFSFPIIVLDQKNHGFSLSKFGSNSFKETSTNKFFETGLSLDRLPRYLPFSLEACQSKDIVPFVVQHLVSLLIKRKTIISLPEFCEGFIPSWRLIGIEKQKELLRVVKVIINGILRNKVLVQLAKRIGDNPPTWTLMPDVFIKNPKGFQKKLSEFIREVQGKTYQLSFDFESET